jgi:hypothetical protein
MSHKHTIIFPVGDIGYTDESCLFNEIQSQSQPDMKEIDFLFALTNSRQESEVIAMVD